MADVLLTIACVVIGLDVLTNAVLILYYPKWEQVKKNEIEDIKKQNEELRAFIKECLHDGK